MGSHDIAVIWLNKTVSAFNHNLTLNLDGWNSSTIFPILDDKFEPSFVQDTFVKFQGWGDISYDVQTGHPVKASGLYETDIEFVNTSFCKGAFVDQHNTSRYHTFLDFTSRENFVLVLAKQMPLSDVRSRAQEVEMKVDHYFGCHTHQLLRYRPQLYRRVLHYSVYFRQ